MKNIIIIKLLVISCLFISNKLSAQENSVVKMELAEESNKTHGRTSQAIKINPLLFFRGDIPVYYERNIFDNISVEAGVGITLADYLSNLSINSDIFWDLDDDVETEVKTGYSFRVGLKYYATDYSFQPEGIYFGMSFRQQTYNSELLNVGDILANNESLRRINNDIILTLGYVHVFEENAFIEPYAGFGFRNRKFDNVSGIVNGFTGNMIFYTIENKSDMIPLLSLGFKVGINF